MTPGDPRSPADPKALRGERWEDAAFLVLAVAVIVLPTWLGSSGGGRVEVRRGQAEPVRIDVNAASWPEWTLLEGIGEVRARRLVDYREAHGPFRTPEDLRAVPGMPGGWVDRHLEHLEFRE